MSCDKLVYDLSSETEGSPNVFVRKDWINILDNQTQNYQSNQSVIDTSQLSNSNKWMSYREAYLEIPLTLSIACETAGTGTLSSSDGAGVLAPGIGTPGFVGYTGAAGVQPTRSADLCVGLKNWFGQIIHSFTLDYNGTTIIQQTPFINMWNSFKLMTTLSWQDVLTQGAHIGFYPDKSTSWVFNDVPSACGVGTCNNGLYPSTGNEFFPGFVSLESSTAVKPLEFNDGYTKRMSYIASDPYAVVGALTFPTATAVAAVQPGTWNQSNKLLTKDTYGTMWRTYISGRAGTVAQTGSIVYSIMATVYLKHIHSFFNMCPLLKGVYMKMTMNLNNCTSKVAITPGCKYDPPIAAAGATQGYTYGMGTIALTQVSNSVGGVNPLMISSASASPYSVDVDGDVSLKQGLVSAGTPLTSFLYNAAAPQNYYANISVGSQILDPTTATLAGVSGALAKSVYLYVPAYTFNPVFEQAYLSSPVKTVKYTDVYQYQVKDIAPTSTFNNLITNGIANIKSVLILPFYSVGSATDVAVKGSGLSVPVYQSPFDPAGTGPTSPLTSALNNFNVVISGQNAIYNTERYTFEHFVNQVYGQNAVNGGLTDGLTSSLIDFKDWMSSYCYYYTNVERMLPVEQTVPKSVQIQGVNQTDRKLDLWVFVEYGTQIQIDAITGARV